MELTAQSPNDYVSLRDRLVKEVRLRNVSTMDDANAFASASMDDYDR